MNSVDIIYRVKLSQDRLETFNFRLDEETFDLIGDKVPDPPKWTELEYSQCAHCPLSTEEHTHCPLALQMHSIVDRFHDTRSIDEVVVEVVTEERRVRQKTGLQRVVASMLDLIYPICGCPKTAFMKPLARFHLPLCSEEETIFRVTGMYLLAQYFLSRSATGQGRIEFDGLTDIYNELHTLNTAVARRLQSATSSDSTKNAITLMDMYSTLVPLLLEDELIEMRGFFQAYLPDDGDKPQTMTNYLEKAKAFSLDLDNLKLTPTEEEASHDEMPDWLKEAKGIMGPYLPENLTRDSSETKPGEKAEPAAFVTSDGLKLELTPMDEERKPEE
ncbi:hypothetical protein Y5S_02141 [Alcanivorax nanhaiticus]|uniref:Uncharacterized protein n=1 Tax=Alcanivorax nanhaiticus TaxID=1177154 RepID=A0A095UQF5_9GAMM|nr:hypothetical protein [Alcanivorax nanhaiticus]KGD64775.1 hypothetical protein Y5S_02141 [Alcanivorax nanhaiticus]